MKLFSVYEYDGSFGGNLIVNLLFTTHYLKSQYNGHLIYLKLAQLHSLCCNIDKVNWSLINKTVDICHEILEHLWALIINNWQDQSMGEIMVYNTRNEKMIDDNFFMTFRVPSKMETWQ